MSKLSSSFTKKKRKNLFLLCNFFFDIKYKSNSIYQASHLVTDINFLILLSATSSLLPYLTIHMQSIGLTVEEIAIIYLALPFTTFLSPPITGKSLIVGWNQRLYFLG